MDSIYFSYGGIESKDMGVLLVKVDSSGGLIRYPFLQENNIISEQIPGRDTFYVYGFNRQPLKFTINLTLEEGLYWDTETRHKIGAWLDNGRFNEFFSFDDPDKRYFVMVESSPDFMSNTNQQGYVTVNLINIDAFTYSPVMEETYDFSTITSSTTFQFPKNGNRGVDMYPDMEITKYGDGNLNIINLSNGGHTFGFTSLVDQEQLTIDNENRIIISNYGNRIDSFNGNYLSIVYGINRLQIDSPCEIKFTYRHKLKG